MTNFILNPQNNMSYHARHAWQDIQFSESGIKFFRFKLCDRQVESPVLLSMTPFQLADMRETHQLGLINWWASCMLASNPDEGSSPSPTAHTTGYTCVGVLAEGRWEISLDGSGVDSWGSDSWRSGPISLKSQHAADIRLHGVVLPCHRFNLRCNKPVTNIFHI